MWFSNICLQLAVNSIGILVTSLVVFIRMDGGSLVHANAIQCKPLHCTTCKLMQAGGMRCYHNRTHWISRNIHAGLMQQKQCDIMPQKSKRNWFLHRIPHHARPTVSILSLLNMFHYNSAAQCHIMLCLSLIHIWRCRRIERCRSRWSPYH